MQQSFSNEPSHPDDQSYPLTLSQRALQRDLRGYYIAIFLHPYPGEHGRSRSGRFITGIGSTFNPDDCRASKQDIIHFINTRKWIFIRLGSKCREHEHRVGYMELRDGTLTMYNSYQFAYVLGPTITIGLENI